MPVHKSESGLQFTVTDALTPAYLKRLSRQTYTATAIVIFISVVSLIWLVFHLGGTITIGRSTLLVFYANAMYAFVSFVGAFWCFQTVYRAHKGPVIVTMRHRRAWLLIGLGLLANGIGGVIYTYLEDYVMQNPVPSPADFFYMLTYVLIFAGLLLVPTVPKTRQSLKLIVLDTLITTLCILDISWYFVLRPIFSTFTDLPQLYTAASYPFWDILLIMAIILLVYQRTNAVLKRSLIICGIGVFVQTGADTLYAMTLPSNSYSTGTWYIDTFWFVGYLLIGLSIPYQYASIARRAFREREQKKESVRSARKPAIQQSDGRQPSTSFFSGAIVSVAVVALIAVGIYSEMTHQQNSTLIIIAGVVGFLLTMRFVVSNYENQALLAERDQRREQADMLRLLTTQLTEEIQLDRLVTRITISATTLLGFDTTALLLIQSHEQPPDGEFSLLVRAAADNFGSVATWQIEAERFQYSDILSDESLQVYWPEKWVEVPECLAKWHKEQEVFSTLFIPLITQEKKLGCLAFSSRSLRSFDENQAHLAAAFAEQAARTIQQAHVYEEARERELFAQALTTVAARLNAAVTTGAGVGTDIQQLICTEGARAMQADFAILYMASRTNMLSPVAVASRDQDAGSLIADWPPVHARTPETRALDSLQPELMAINDMTSSGLLPAVTGPLLALPMPAQQRGVSTATGPVRVPTGGLRGRKMISLRTVLMQRGVRTAIFAPLIMGNSAVALLVLARSNTINTQHKRFYTRADLEQARDFAEQATIAFTNTQLYHQIRQAHRQLQELDQLKDQFMITASHELRTPLTSVQGYLELLAQFGDTVPPEQRQEFLQKARRGCDELVLLLSNVMDASRLEIEAGIRPAHLEPVSVTRVMQDVIMLIEPQLNQEKRQVYMRVPEHLDVRADPARLRQVVLNLCTNALKYSRAGTPLAFAARAYHDQRPSVIISVSDRGKGIKPEDQVQIFQRFVRLESDLNSAVRGSGLGLYISRRLIEAMDGRIFVESSGIPGEGSTFSIQLPLA